MRKRNIFFIMVIIMISFTVLKIHRYDEDISVEAPKDINVLISQTEDKV